MAKVIALKARVGGDPTVLPWRGKVLVSMVVPVAAQDANHAKRDVMEQLQKAMRQWPWPSEVQVSTGRGPNGARVVSPKPKTKRKGNGKAKGENNLRSKLTQEKVREIRALAAAGELPQAAIAKKYGISQSVASAIVTRKIWRHVD